MKRKSIIAILAVLLVLLLCAFAFAFAQEQKPFSLRNGYTWGMTREEAQKLAEEEGLEFLSETQIKNYYKVYYQNVPVAGVNAIRFSLDFYDNNSLRSITYDLTEDTESSLALFPLMQAQLEQAYDALGEHEEGEIGESFHWYLQDTTITLFFFSLSKDVQACSIIYTFTPPTQAQPTLSTDGL